MKKGNNWASMRQEANISQDFELKCAPSVACTNTGELDETLVTQGSVFFDNEAEIMTEKAGLKLEPTIFTRWHLLDHVI